MNHIAGAIGTRTDERRNINSRELDKCPEKLINKIDLSLLSFSWNSAIKFRDTHRTRAIPEPTSRIGREENVNGAALFRLIYNRRI